MGTLFHDLRYAARTLRKVPAFGITAVVTLALGIGASTAIFSVVNAVLLRPLPYANADRLVLVWQDLRARNVVDFPIAPGDYPEIADQKQAFEEVAAVSTFRQSISGDANQPEQIRAAAVTTNFLSMIGAKMAAGRGFQESDGVPDPPPPAAGAAGAAGAGLATPPQQQAQAVQAPPPPVTGILSHGFWQRRYGGDRSVIGKTFDLGGGSVQIVGVLAPGVELLFPPGTGIERSPDLWTALRVDYARASRINVFLRVIARLRPDVTVERAQAQLDTLSADLRQRFPIKTTSNMALRIEPMQEDLIADVRPAVLTLMGAVLFVLLIACANVANLLLVRMSTRTRELAVRAALGGSRWRLVRQMIAESLVLAAAGAALGLAFAQMGIDLLMRLRPDNLPRIDGVAIDPFVLAFASGTALIAALLFGVVPAWRASRPDLMDVLRSSGRTSALGGGRLLRSSVVMVEVALAFVLLIGCGLMLRSFVALQRVNPGFDPNGVLTFNVQTQGPRYRQPAQREAFIKQLRERLGALPGVTAVTAANPLPLDGELLANGRWGTEEAAADPGKFQQSSVYFVLPGYFEAMKTQVLEGRTFTDADNVPNLMKIVVDRRLAKKAFPNGSAVGRQILARTARTVEAERFEIIGVVDHQRGITLAAEGRETIYFVDGFLGHGVVQRWAVRTTGDPERLSAAVRAEVAKLDPRLPVSQIQPMTEFLTRAAGATRFALVLIGVFGAVAAALAAIGLYGVLSTMVRQRTAEIGVRMAFGAPPSSIFRLMVGHGLLLSIAGIGGGLVAAFLLTRVMTSMLVGVAPTDPLTFVSIAVVFLGIAALASWLPARRAARLDPTGALRDE